MDVDGTETNIVMVEVEPHINMTATTLCEELEQRQVLVLPVGKYRMMATRQAKLSISPFPFV